MNSMIRTKLVVSALLAASLAGCNAVEDVREAPFLPVPTAGVVLQGKVSGPLGNLRAVTLLNNGDNDHAIGVTASLGTAYTTFTFGVVPVGSPYNITVKSSPFGKICTVSGGSGTVTTAAALNIVVSCVNNPAVPRYNLRVKIPSTFGSIDGAKVQLTTEEGRYVIENPANSPADPDRVGTIGAGATTVTFNDVLFNNVVGGTVWGASSPGTTAVTSTANGGINPYTNIVGGVVNGATFAWKVTATTSAGSTPDKPQVNNCAMSAASNFNASSSGTPGTPNFGTAIMPPVGNIGFGTVTTQIPTVTGCTFTIGGNVSYSYPFGVTPPGPVQALPSGGLDLQLRDVQGEVLETLTYTGSYAASPTATTAGSGYVFTTPRPSSVNSVYDVVVSRHPTGQYCVVTNGGQATLGVATTNITNVNVVCRARPTGAANNAKLRGTYLFLNGVAYNYPSPSPAASTATTTETAADGTITSTVVRTTTLNTQTTYNSDFGGAIPGPPLNPVGESWGNTNQNNLSIRTTISTQLPPAAAVVVSDVTVLSVPAATTNNNVSRNFLTFFEDGTFLHGVHSSTITLATNQIEHGFYWYDTTATTPTIRFTLITDTNLAGTTSLVNTGLSGTGGAATVNGSPTATMTNVAKGTTNGRPTLTGKFQATSGYGATTAGSRWSMWNMIEPRNTDGHIEGPFVSQDHRRVWVYDDNPKLGFHVGVNGGAANLQDACFTVENSVAASGFLSRRGGTAVSCLGNIVPIDIPQTITSTTPTPVGTPATLVQLPGFVGRIPGSSALIIDGRPPSPTYYVVAKADLFAAAVAADPGAVPFFPAAETTPAALSWCLNAAGTGPGEVYGVRTSLNGIPDNKAVYLCRQRAN